MARRALGDEMPGIMLRGFIVESGPVEAVLNRPLHPYTRLLRDSVPEPTLKERELWATRIDLGSTEIKEYSRVGCKFAGRCPAVMDICRTADPPDVETEGRIVKCYLYTGSAGPSHQTVAHEAAGTVTQEGA